MWKRCLPPNDARRARAAYWAGVLSGLALTAGVLFPAFAAPPSGQRRGELVRLVRQDCGSCHGLTLNGGLGKPLLPETLRERDAHGIADVILEGLAGTPMPPWKGLMTREDALWIAERLKEGFPQ
jgi:cytochrome c55X